MIFISEVVQSSGGDYSCEGATDGASFVLIESLIIARKTIIDYYTVTKCHAAIFAPKIKCFSSFSIYLFALLINPCYLRTSQPLNFECSSRTEPLLQLARQTVQILSEMNKSKSTCSSTTKNKKMTKSGCMSRRVS